MNQPERSVGVNKGLTLRAMMIWIALVLAIALPILLAAHSPLLAWRDPIYIIAGFAGIIGMLLLFVQPLLMLDALPGLCGLLGRKVHRIGGVALLMCIVLHVAGLWITSPPDVVDALTLKSPTPFSIWGVIAMWAVFATALLAATRRRFRIRPRHWRAAHIGLALVIALGTILHAVLIEGTMEWTSKIALCVLVGAATLSATRILFKR